MHGGVGLYCRSRTRGVSDASVTVRYLNVTAVGLRAWGAALLRWRAHASQMHTCVYSVYTQMR